MHSPVLGPACIPLDGPRAGQAGPSAASRGRLSYGAAEILSLNGLTGSWFGRPVEHSTYLSVLLVSVVSLWSRPNPKAVLPYRLGCLKIKRLPSVDYINPNGETRTRLVCTFVS
jgi:hypothetical protein